MHPIYCADAAIHNAIADALDLYGLWPDPAAVIHRPHCADRFDHQLARVERSITVLETVRSWVRVDDTTRRLIERLVDSASESIEREESCPRPAEPALLPPIAAPTPAPPIIQSSRAKRKAVRA